MSITVNFFGTATGISSTIGTYRWNGHSFNPTGNTSDGYQTWNPWTESWSGFALSGATASFNISGYQYGNEVVVAGLKFTTSIADSGLLAITFKDPDGNVLFTYSLSWSMAAGYSYSTWAGIGIKADNAEIWKNGDYTAEYMITYGGGYVNGSYTFTISNYPAATHAASSAGSIWVEGDNLCFICAQTYKIACKNDGSTDYVGTDYSGCIWLETDGKIAYVDSSGYKRFTKLGDRYGWLGLSSEIPSAPGASYKGSIWVSNDFNDTYLMIISNNGVKYRIGAGYAPAGDYQ